MDNGRRAAEVVRKLLGEANACKTVNNIAVLWRSQSFGFCKFIYSCKLRSHAKISKSKPALYCFGTREFNVKHMTLN